MYAKSLASRRVRAGSHHVQHLLSHSVLALTTLLALSPRPAQAVDGCLVLLCLAAPEWRAIPQCLSPVRQLFRDLARGRPFPTCAISGAGNSAGNRWANAPRFCPPQYTRVFDGESGPVYSCDYGACITVTVNGSPFSRTWWKFGGESITELAPAAKAQFGTWDTRFDDDCARWRAMQPPATPADPSPGS